MSETGSHNAKIDLSLKGLEVGLSGAIPEREKWTERAMDRGILEFVALFSGLIFKYGGRIVHGSHPSFTPVILRQARLHSTRADRQPVTLVMSDLWYVDYSADEIQSMTDVAELIVTKKIGDGTVSHAQTRNDSLTAMRKVLIAAQNMMVAVGGKMHDRDGANPGVAEEMALAEHCKIPRYLIGGLGGYSQKLAMELTPTSLNNELSILENVELFSTDDVSSCVNIVFENLCQHYWKNKRIQLPPISLTGVEEFIHTIVSRTDVSLVGQVSTDMQQIAESPNELSLRTLSLEENSAKISDIVGTIKVITDQTNTLGLNVATQAARAGEMGQGFAVVANKAAVDILLAVANTALASAERLAALNLEIARSDLEDAAYNAKALLGAKGLKEAVVIQTSLAQSGVEKTAAYGKYVYEIFAQMQEQLSKMVEDQFHHFQMNVVSMMEKDAKSVPAGSEVAVAAVRSAITAASSTFDNMRKAALQVSDLAQNNIAAATTATVKSAKKATGKSAKKASGK